MVKLHNMLISNVKLAKFFFIFYKLINEILTFKGQEMQFSKKNILFFRPLHAASLSLSCFKPRQKDTFMVEFLSVQNCNILRNSKFKLAFFQSKNIIFSKTFEIKVLKQHFIFLVRDFHSLRLFLK